MLEGLSIPKSIASNTTPKSGTRNENLCHGDAEGACFDTEDLVQNVKQVRVCSLLLDDGSQPLMLMGHGWGLVWSLNCSLRGQLVPP